MSFSRYNTEDSVVSSDTIITGAWVTGSGATNTITNFYTSSYNEYYTNVYAVSSSVNVSASVQFCVQYGHVSGSGSAYINPSVTGISPSRIVYGEYRNLVYGASPQNFSLDGGTTFLEDIYVINIARSSYKESIYPGSLSFSLNGHVFTDDSALYTNTRFIGENRYYNIIYTDNSVVGWLFPDLNIMILDPTLLNTDSGIGIPTRTANAASYNQNLIVRALMEPVLSDPFRLQSAETISSRYFFTRVKNSEFNYTTNPSIIDSSGNLIYNSLVDSPQTFITTVGLYNDNNELLAVAKLSKPLTKDFTKEALIRVKIGF